MANSSTNPTGSALRIYAEPYLSLPLHLLIPLLAAPVFSLMGYWCSLPTFLPVSFNLFPTVYPLHSSHIISSWRINHSNAQNPFPTEWKPDYLEDLNKSFVRWTSLCLTHPNISHPLVLCSNHNGLLAISLLLFILAALTACNTFPQLSTWLTPPFSLSPCLDVNFSVRSNLPCTLSPIQSFNLLPFHYFFSIKKKKKTGLTAF